MQRTHGLCFIYHHVVLVLCCMQLAAMEAWMRTQEPPVDKDTHTDAACDGRSSTCSYGRTSPTSVLYQPHSPSYLSPTPHHSPTHANHYTPSHSVMGTYAPSPASQLPQQHQTYYLSPRPSSAAAALASEVLHSQMESNFARASLSPVAPMQPAPVQPPPVPFTPYTTAAAGVLARLSATVRL